MTTPDTVTTTTTTTVERRRRYVLRTGMWLLAPFVDSWDGLSLNRFLAVLFGMAAVQGRFIYHLPITMADVSLATVAGALAFSKDVFIALLEHRSVKDGDKG